MKSTRRNTLQLLCDHLEWCFWNWACTGGWRLWELRVRTSTSPPLSVEHWESTMSPWGRIFPSIVQTLVNHQQLHSSIKSPHLIDTDATALTHHQLVFTSSDNESPVRPSEWCSQQSSTNARSQVHRRAELSSSVHISLCHPNTPMPTTDQFLTDAWDSDTAYSAGKLPNSTIKWWSVVWRSNCR